LSPTSNDNAPGNAFELLDVEAAWRVTRGRENVIVGVIDSRARIDHPDLRKQVWLREEKADLRAPVSDAHGTQTVSVIAAIAPGVRIFPVAVRPVEDDPDERLAYAIEYAVDSGASILNLSLALRCYLPRVREALRYAESRGVLVVCAAGNQGEDLAVAQVYPAAFALELEPPPNLLVVMAVTRQLTVASNYSARGVHLAAPNAARVPGTLGAGSALAFASSIATPFVTAVAALLKSAHPTWVHGELVARLLAAATPHPELAGRCSSGAMVHAGKALSSP
jgi:subtilisin family serine protease